MKRALDLIVCIPVLILFSPVLLVTAALVRLNLGSPIIFKQQRPGLNAEIFTLFKFRSMKNGFDKDGNTLPDSMRLTRFGAFIRSTSLDELPAMWNVIRGDMSLVGPRPLLMDYLPRYSPEQARRHEVRPGITGWAQVNGRNSLDWEEKFELDVWYIENHTILLDLKILFLTVKKVLLRSGINHDGNSTMPEFKGTQR